MRHHLSREDYNRLFSPGDAYPASTSAVACELRTRGLNASLTVLAHLIESGQIPAPEKRAGRLEWQISDIEHAAELLAQRGSYTPHGMACLNFNIDMAQQIQAERDFQAEHPDADPASFVMTIVPGHPAELCQYARVSYRGPISRR